MAVLWGIEWLFAIPILIVFANRYVFGSILRLADRRTEPGRAGDPPVWPSVVIVVPVYNEGPSVLKTADSFARLDYPHDRLSIVFVDDCSTDDTYGHLLEVAKRYDWMHVSRNPRNMGKRLGIKQTVLDYESDLVLSVDSDVVVEPCSLRKLVAHMYSTGCDAVGGCVFVSNADDTWLTRMQAVKYWIGYQFLKNLENAFDHVLCLSGCLTLYKRDALLAVDEDVASRRFLGSEIKYGEDRYLTRKLVERGFRTRLCFDARCYTKAPPTMPAYLNQQLRWRRSNSVDLITALPFLGRFHPLVLVHYLSMGLLLFFDPLFLISQLLRMGFVVPMIEHALVVTVFAVAYELNKHKLPPAARTSGVWFLCMAVVFPVMYITMTPLALATLATSSWETRGGRKAAAPATGGAAT